jgi:GNAT superfamily N-acetyltransferase
MSPAGLARAVERNHAGFLLSMGRARGGEESADPRVRWTIGGSPIAYHNAVVAADLAVADADDVIAASRVLMEAKGVPGSWHVGPSMRPGDLGARLEAHGFEGGPEPELAVDLDALARPEAPPELTVARVSDLAGYEAVLAGGFGEGPVEARWVRETFDRLASDPAWQHVVGSVGEEPVATASIFLDGDVAGIYFVCTAPRFRRRGYGAAITCAALDGARELGYRVGVLGSSPMGRAVYERLGFVEVCAVGVYEWPVA